MRDELQLQGPVALVSSATEFAGAEVYAAVLVEELKGRCEFVAILGDGAADEARMRLSEAGAEVVTVPGLRRRPSPPAIRRLAHAIRDVRPALLHANLSDQGDGLTALAAGQRARVPLMATLHLVLPGRAAWLEALSRRALRRFDAVVGVSHAVGRYIAGLEARAVVVKNGLPRTEAEPDPRGALGLEPDAFVVGGVGRLHEQKGWDVLCRAAPLVRRELPNVVFAVIGEGPERSALATLPECAEVRFLGHRPRAASLIPGFDVLVVPSRFEGLGLTPLEALFQGVPVVASNIDGLAEALGDCALLVPPDNPEALARAILRIASAPDVRSELVEKGLRRANEFFTAERMADETFAVYQAVAAGPRSDAAANLMKMQR